RVPERGGEGDLLRGLLQQHPLAALPLLPLQGQVRGCPVGGLRARQPGLRRRGRRGGRARRPGLGPRLPPPAAAGPLAREDQPPAHRLLPAHPLSLLRDLPPPARPLSPPPPSGPAPT